MSSSSQYMLIPVIVLAVLITSLIMIILRNIVNRINGSHDEVKSILDSGDFSDHKY